AINRCKEAQKVLQETKEILNTTPSHSLAGGLHASKDFPDRFQVQANDILEVLLDNAEFFTSQYKTMEERQKQMKKAEQDSLKLVKTWTETGKITELPEFMINRISPTRTMMNLRQMSTED